MAGRGDASKAKEGIPVADTDAGAPLALFPLSLPWADAFASLPNSNMPWVFVSLLLAEDWAEAEGPPVSCSDRAPTPAETFTERVANWNNSVHHHGQTDRHPRHRCLLSKSLD